MDKIKKLIPLVLFCFYFTKVSILGATYPDTLVLLILGAFSAFIEYKNNDQQIKDLINKIDGRQKDLEAYIKDIDSLKTSVNAIKVSSGMRPLNVTSR